MFIMRLCISGVLLVSVLGSFGYRRTGWLDRVVAWRKQQFIKDVQKYAPIKINAELHQAPPGYVDSQEWTYDSVMRLLVLIRGSEGARLVHKQLRRMLKPTRRIMMSMKESMIRFPSLGKNEPNDFYYSMESAATSEEQEPPEPVPEDDVVIVVSNPVEARLPSARISVRLLRDILEARARAGRATPSTPKSTIWWKPMNKTTTIAHTSVDGEGGDGGAGGETAASGEPAPGGEADPGGEPDSGGTTAPGDGAATGAMPEPTTPA